MEMRNTEKHFEGCLLGGAVGDALGAPVEFLSLTEIHRKFGKDGITGYEEAYGRKGAITDDTQMTLFTAEGLILQRVKGGDLPPAEVVYQAYLRWLSTQEYENRNLMLKQYGSCVMVDGILTGFKELYSQRAPGASCLSALKSGRMGSVEEPINNSKGCGGVMRIAPVGLFCQKEFIFDTACGIAAITHGHPSGFLAAGCLAHIIGEILGGANLPGAVNETMNLLKERPHSAETLSALERALETWKSAPASPSSLESLGEGWIAPEALSMGVYCALVGGDDFGKGVLLSVNHGGDSDSTGSVTGNIMGALLGPEAIPGEFINGLELSDLIGEIGRDLFRRRGC